MPQNKNNMNSKMASSKSIMNFIGDYLDIQEKITKSMLYYHIDRPRDADGKKDNSQLDKFICSKAIQGKDKEDKCASPYDYLNHKREYSKPDRKRYDKSLGHYGQIYGQGDHPDKESWSSYFIMLCGFHKKTIVFDIDDLEIEKSQFFHSMIQLYPYTKTTHGYHIYAEFIDSNFPEVCDYYESNRSTINVYLSEEGFTDKKIEIKIDNIQEDKKRTIHNLESINNLDKPDFGQLVSYFFKDWYKIFYQGQRIVTEDQIFEPEKPISFMSNSKDTQVSVIIEILKVINTVSYLDWFKIAVYLKNILKADKSIWMKFNENCKNSDGESRDLDKINKQWDNIPEHYDKSNLGVLKNIIKKINPSFYQTFLKGKFIYSDQPLTPFENLKSDYEIADMLKIVCGNDFIMQNGQLYVWYENKKRWFKDDKPHRLANNYLRIKLKEIGESRLKDIDLTKNEEEAEKYKNCAKKLAGIVHNKLIKDILDAFITVLTARFDDIEFDFDPYLFAFNNQVYDFKINQFRDAKRNDYLTMNSNFDYHEPTLKEKDEMKDIIEKIFTNEESRKCYMSILKNGLIGICPEKFVVANGSGRNGKGVLNDLHRDLCGDYAYKGNCDTLISPLKSGPNPEIANMHKKRFITFSEPNVNQNLSTSSVKELSGGSGINARACHSNDTAVDLNAVIVLETNQKPNLDGTDSDSTALKERVIDILFDSEFSAKNIDEVNVEERIFMQNPYFKTKEFKDKYRCALFDYLVNYQDIDKIYVPECVKERSKQYLLGSDIIYQFAKDAIIKTNDNTQVVKIKKLYETFKMTDLFTNMDKKEKRIYKQSYFISQIEKHSYFKRHYRERVNVSCVQYYNVLVGFDYKQQENESDDNDEL